MTVYMVVAFLTFVSAYHITGVVIDLAKRILHFKVENKMLRGLIVFIFFIIAVTFNLKWRNTQNIVGLLSFLYVFAYGATLRLLIYCIWTK